MLAFDIITIFPGFFEGPFNCGVIRRARESGLIRTEVHDLRDYTEDKHQTVDDRPFGGGEGMVLKPEPIFESVEKIQSTKQSKVEVVVLSASGRLFSQGEALRLSKAEQVILVCGRYEGIDERVIEELATSEISIGNYVVSGGEVAATVIVDAVTRYVPGSLGNDKSVLNDSFSAPEALTNRIEHPHYTRPSEYRGLRVPEVLVSGNHTAIATWRRTASLKKTLKNRPDLLHETFSDGDEQIDGKGLESHV